MVSRKTVACEQALLFGRAKRAARERMSERRSREGPRGLSLPRPCLRVSSRVPLVRPLFMIPAKQRACSQARKTPTKSLADDVVQLAILGI